MVVGRGWHRRPPGRHPDRVNRARAAAPPAPPLPIEAMPRAGPRARVGRARADAPAKEPTCPPAAIPSDPPPRSSSPSARRRPSRLRREQQARLLLRRQHPHVLRPTSTSRAAWSGISPQVQAIKTNADDVVSSAKSDFPTQTSAISSSVTTLQNAVKALPSSPSAANVLSIGADAAAVASAVKGFTDATSSKC